MQEVYRPRHNLSWGGSAPILSGVADPGFGQGGPRKFFQDFANTGKWSQVSKVS